MLHEHVINGLRKIEGVSVTTEERDGCPNIIGTDVSGTEIFSALVVPPNRIASPCILLTMGGCDEVVEGPKEEEMVSEMISRLKDFIDH